MLRKLFRYLMLGCFAFVLAGVGAWMWVEHDAEGRIAADIRDAAPVQAGIVLGTSRRVRDGHSNLYFTHRIEAAADLFHAGKVQYLIVSGNQQAGGRYDEPADMRDALVAKGVPANRIYRDRAGFRTLDSVLRAKQIFGQDKAIIISQAFHVERALFLAHGNGLDFTGFAAKDVPDSYGLRVQAREFVARLGALVDVAVGRGARVGGAEIRLGQDAAG